MSASAWRSLAVVLLLSTPGLAQTDSLPLSTPPPPEPHTPVRFLHDRFHLTLTSEFAAASLDLASRLPGPWGLSGQGQAARLPATGYRENSVPFQAGETYVRSGSGSELGIRADRRLWEAEALGFPPSGADDPALYPGPADSAFFMPVPLSGFQASELVFWRDPALTDSARATARYTNGPSGYSYTGGRLRTELGAGFETDAQVYRIFSDGLADSSHFDGHNLDLELRKTWGRVPTRLRFRQNRAARDLLFRWQEDPSRARHRYYLTNLDLEAALPGNAHEWLVAYQVRVTDQELRATPALANYQYWFERTHRFGLSRVAEGSLAWWGSVTAELLEADLASGLPQAWSSEASLGAKLSRASFSWLASVGARASEHGDPAFRAATALRNEFSPGHVVVAYAGLAQEEASSLRRYLPADSGVTLSVRGASDLPNAEHMQAAFAWRYEKPRLHWNLLVSEGRSTSLADWQPQGDTATLSAHYAPVITNREAVSASGRLRVSPVRFIELEGSWRHDWLTGGTLASAYSPEDTWWGAFRLPIESRSLRLRVVPEVSALAMRGGTLPEEGWTLSAGATATLKQLTVFWFRDNIKDEPFATGGAWPGYGTHSRFGFYWDFWN